MYLPDRCRLMYRFRHRSLFSLYSRPCKTALSDLFLPAVATFSQFSVQRHQHKKLSSTRLHEFRESSDIFPEILFLEGREFLQIKLLCRISSPRHHLIHHHIQFSPRGTRTPPLRTERKMQKTHFPHYFFHISILQSPNCVMISIEIQRIGGLPNE